MDKWTPPEIFPELDETWAFDFETYDPKLSERGPGWAFKGEDDPAYILGIAVAAEGFQAYYPIAHPNDPKGHNLDPDKVTRWFAAQLAKDTQKVVHNAQYELGFCMVNGWKIGGRVEDTQTAAPLIDEYNLSYGLDDLGFQYTGFRKDETSLYRWAEEVGLKYRNPKHLKEQIWKAPPEVMGPYGEQDANLTLRLWRELRELLLKEDLGDIYQLECDVIPVVLAMRERGVRVNIDRAEEVFETLNKTRDDLVAEVKRKTGVEVSLTNNSTILPILQEMGITPPLTPKTRKPSIKSDWLEELNDPVLQMIVRAKKINKINKDFVGGAVVNHSHRGRIHAQFNPLKSDDGGTVGGRFSCRTPNLQQIPARDPELSPIVRSLFLPESDQQWGALDYSSQEPRLTVHFAAVANVKGGWDAAERFRQDPRTDYHQMVADLCGISRKAAKTINLGLTYGMGEAKLCHSLGLETIMEERYGRMMEVAGPEGRALLDQYHSNAPFIRALDRMARNYARDRGWIKTLLGRKCHFPLIDGKRWFTHKALNRLIQGSAADQTKKAMVDMHKAGLTLLIQVHDEIDISWGSEAELRQAVEIMENCVNLEVPMLIDAEVGPTWGDCELIELPKAA